MPIHAGREQRYINVQIKLANVREIVLKCGRKPNLHLLLEKTPKLVFVMDALKDSALVGSLVPSLAHALHTRPRRREGTEEREDLHQQLDRKRVHLAFFSSPPC